MRGNEDGMTPLLAASEMDHVDAVEALLSAGAAINQPRNDGCTPLLMASILRSYRKWHIPWFQCPNSDTIEPHVIVAA